MYDFDWFADRLDLAKWESQEAGSRSAFFGCPVHGGSDSLHISEKNSAALVHCFSCSAGYVEVVEALEGTDTEEPEEKAAPVRIKRRGRVVDLQSVEVEPDRVAGETGGSTPPRLHQKPLDWLATRCGLTRAQLEALDLPLSETADMVVFEFPNARKLRGMGEGKKGKVFAWSGDDSPPIWPLPDSPSREIVVCEGESDAICLRASGIEAYSITKGANSEVPSFIWEALVSAGVHIVRIVFDLDEAGRKGRDKAIEGARSAGLDARESRVVGIEPLLGEKDARSVALRLGYPLEIEDDTNEDDARMLSSVDAALPSLPLLGFLHPLEHTVLYGDGGTGKGVIAAWMVAHLTGRCHSGKHTLSDRPMRVLIVDYEQHASHEWRPRVEKLHGDMDMVMILQPVRPIWEIAGWLRGQIERWEIDYVVIDSVSYACVGEEPEASTTAVRYSMAVAQLQTPVLSIAHVTKAEADPKHPFGSVFWSNGARVTIAMSVQGDDPDSLRILRNSKTNQRAPFPMVAVEWPWVMTDLPDDLTFRAAFRSARAATQAFIRAFNKPPTPEELLEFSGLETNENAIKQASHGMSGQAKVPRVTRTKKGVDTGEESV